MKPDTIKRLSRLGINVVIPYNSNYDDGCKDYTDIDFEDTDILTLLETISEFNGYKNITFVERKCIDGDDHLVVDYFCVYNDNKYAQNIFFSDEEDVPGYEDLTGYTMIIDTGVWSCSATHLSNSAIWSSRIDVIKLEELQL